MIIKMILCIFVPIFLFAGNDDKYAGLSKSEVKFVKNIERIQEEKLSKIHRPEKDKLMVEFGSIKYLLNTATGFVENLWILGDDDITWEEMGPEY